MKADAEIKKAELSEEESESQKQSKEQLKAKEEGKDFPKQVVSKSENLETKLMLKKPPDLKPKKAELKIPEIKYEDLPKEYKIDLRPVQLEKIRAKNVKLIEEREPELSFQAEISVKKPPLISPKTAIKKEIPEVGEQSFEKCLDIDAWGSPSIAPKPTVKKEIPEISNLSGSREDSLEIKKVPEEDVSEKSVTPQEIFVPPIFNVISSAARPINRPICIVLPKKEDDSFVYSIAIICREIYRMIKGEEPVPRWISQGLKEEIEERLKAGDRIFVIDDPKGKLLPGFDNVKSCKDLIERIDREMLFDRLKELFSQDLGFVIFHLDERFSSQFANLLREKVGAFINIIEIQIPDLHQEAKEFLAKACWGFAEGKGETFDEFFGSCEKIFFDKLNEAKEDVELSHYVGRDENASPEHESMKILAVKCLAKELGAKDRREIIKMLENKEIKTEYELNGERAEIYVPSQGRFVEIETFYGTEDPIEKLDKKTLKKYRKYGGKGKVDIILLTGIQAFLYAHRLFDLAKIHRKYNLEVNFYLPNLKEEKLIPLEHVLSKLKEILGFLKSVTLTDEEVEKLWNEFSKALLERGKNPEDHRGLFNIMVVRHKSFEENLRWMLEEIDHI